MFEGDISRHVDRLTDQKPGTVLSEQPSERMLAHLDWLAPKILAVELEQIERVELGRGVLAIANEQLENRGALLITRDRLAVDQAGAAAQTGHHIRDASESVCPVVATSGQQPHAAVIAERHQAETVVFDFVKPTWSERRVSGSGGQAGFDKALAGGTQTKH